MLNPDRISRTLFYLLIIFLPTQLGKHFWPNFSFVFGLRLDYLSPTFYFTDILILIILLLSSKKIIYFFKKQTGKNVFLFLTFYVFLFLGILSSKNLPAGLYGLLKLTEMIFLSIYVIQNFQNLNKKNLFIAFSIPIIYESLLSLFQLFNNGSMGGLLYFLGERTFNSSTPGIANASINGQLILRPYATFSHPNVLAGFLVIFTLFLLNLFTKKEKVVLIILTALATLSLFSTLSRIAIVYWLICLIILFAISMYKKYKKGKTNIKNVAFILISIFVIVLIFVKDSTLMQRFSETTVYEQSFAQRQELTTSSFNMLIKNPLLGVGINNFYFNLTNTLFIQPVHNIFLLILSQGGIIVFFIIMYVLIKALVIVVRLKNIYLFLALLSITVLGSFDHYFLTLQQGQILTVLVFGAIYSKKNKL